MLPGNRDNSRNSQSEMGQDPVCEFYTAHPYPPPVENLDRARAEWQNSNRHLAEFHLFWPRKPYRSDFDILVAGCGTWQAAKYACCRPDASVVGIDVSATSLDHTEQLRTRYDLTNLELRQLPVENAVELGRRFDLIVCTGVLHHLADPDTGLRALASVLKPDGAIYLMVYAPYGRAGIYMAQDYCRQLGIGTSRKEIEDLVEVVKSMPPNHPLAVVLRSARDAAKTDALADALLNPRDQSYSVRQFFDLIARSDLMFGRWYWQAPYLPMCGSIAATPHANRLAALSEQKQYAAMELFRGTMTAHSAIVYANNARPKIDLAYESFMQYVPVRLPTTLCVLERLPPGAAGVLVNQSHPFRDLILIIDPQEKRIFDLIDGRRSVAEIIARFTGPKDGIRALCFFQKLWWYDQVVFDASRAR